MQSVLNVLSYIRRPNYFFDVTYHVSVVLGTFSYGLIEQLTGSMRNSTLALGTYFIIGFIFLVSVKVSNAGTETSES